MKRIATVLAWNRTTALLALALVAGVAVGGDAARAGTSGSYAPLGGGSSSSASGTLVADWPIADTRWYAIDSTMPDDTGAGYSDVSSAAAGLVAKKTFAGLGAIFPRQGANRKVVVRIAAGTYAEALQTFLSGVTGYAGNFPLILPTVTDATSGSVAFAGDAADKIQAGFVTATGMNAGGYNPVSSFSVTALKCVAVGGGAPGFPAELLAPVPMGYRVRFSATTTTTALRNFATTIIGISASDTLTLPNVVTGIGLPATPAGTDVFYIEMPGVTVSSSVVSITSNGNALASQYFGVPQIVGINFNTTGAFRGFPVRLSGCSGTFASNAAISATVNYADEGATSRVVGSGIRNVGLFGNQFSLGAGLNFNDQSAASLVSTGVVSITNATAFNMPNGAYIAAGIFLQNCHGDVTSNPATMQAGNMIGGRSANNQSPVRVRGVTSTPTGGNTGMAVIMSDVTLGRINFEGIGARPAIQLFGVSSIAVSDVLTGSTGNTDVCLDLVNASGSTVVMASTPTCTGTVGDVRLADGTIVSWATLAAAGVTTDTRGTRIIR